MAEDSGGGFLNLDVSQNCERQNQFAIVRRKLREPQEVEGNSVIVNEDVQKGEIFSRAVNLQEQIDRSTREKVGQGQFGEVFKCQSTDGECYALKEICVARSSIEDLMNEVQILQGLQHENIVTFINYSPNIDEFPTVKTVSILMEFVPDTLKSFLDNNKSKRSEESFIVTYIHQLLKAISYIHSRNIVHCDIKCDNILFNIALGKLKLCDFGLAYDLRKGKITQQKGTINFMSPQAINPINGYGKETDIWSFGCTCYEMMTGYPPFFEYESMTVMFKVGSGYIKPEPPPGSSSIFQNFLSRCWTKDPLERATVEELLVHPFIQGKGGKYPMECSETEDDFDLIDGIGSCAITEIEDDMDCPDEIIQETSFALVQQNQPVEYMPSDDCLEYTPTLVLQQRCQDQDDDELEIENE